MEIKIITEATVTKLSSKHLGHILVCGSHGGVYAGYLAAKAGARGVILNDAGGGLDDSGFSSLAYLNALGRPGATVANFSARIGDGIDMVKRGIISRVNDVAASLGCRKGQQTMDCARAMILASDPIGEPPSYKESRFQFSDRGDTPVIWGVDSASLLRPEDEGQVVLTASHGALLDGQEKFAIKYNVLACAFNDAGVGIDGIGVSRLPALDKRNIASVAIDCQTARIGDVRSMWESGIISHVNETASALGGRVGDHLQIFAQLARLKES